MILDFTKRTVAPGVAVLAMTGSIHCGPECARLEREVDALIAARETRVIFDMAGVTHADSAAIGSIVRCLTKLRGAGGGGGWGGGRRGRGRGGRGEASRAWLARREWCRGFRVAGSDRKNKSK